jgi:hypothetical protein
VDLRRGGAGRTTPTATCSETAGRAGTQGVACRSSTATMQAQAIEGLPTRQHRWCSVTTPTFRSTSAPNHGLRGRHREISAAHRARAVASSRGRRRDPGGASMRRDDDRVGALASQVAAPSAGGRGLERVAAARNRADRTRGCRRRCCRGRSPPSGARARDDPRRRRSARRARRPGRSSASAGSEILAPTALEAWKCRNPIEYRRRRWTAWRDAASGHRNDGVLYRDCRWQRVGSGGRRRRTPADRRIHDAARPVDTFASLVGEA